MLHYTLPTFLSHLKVVSPNPSHFNKEKEEHDKSPLPEFPLLGTNSEAEDEQNNNAINGRKMLGHPVDERLYKNYKDWTPRRTANGYANSNGNGHLNGPKEVDEISSDGSDGHNYNPSQTSIDNENSSSLNPDQSSQNPPVRLPRERWKTLLAFLFLVLAFIVNSISIVLTHERIPDRKRNPPLPDIFLDNLDAHKWANDISDVLVLISGFGLVITILLHKHRYIVARRAFLILGFLYLMRSVTMYVTNLPLSNEIVKCAPKQNGTLTGGLIFSRVIQLMTGMGLPISGMKVVCGDYIFSGHTCIYIISYLFICEYSSKRLVLFHWAAWLVAAVGMIGVIYSRGHYTVDVIIAYYVATRVFWSYHTMANNSVIKNNRGPDNYLSREWWFPIFNFFEGNLRGRVPNKFYKFRSKHKNKLFSSVKLNV